MGYPANASYNPVYGHQNIIALQFNSENNLPRKSPRQKSAKGKNTVYAFRTMEDVKLIGDWFVEHGKYIHKLLFDMELGLGRRIGDIMDSSWSAFFYPNGTYKDYWTPPVREDKRGKIIQGEQKTGKYKEIPITPFIQNAINNYFVAVGVDLNTNYEDKLCMQYTGTYKGKEMTYRGFIKQLQLAAQACGLEYKVASHSMRKTFGKNIIETNPDDPLAKTIVQGLLNHSSEKTTEVYIGLEKEREDNAVNRLNDMFMATLVHGEEYHTPEKQYILSLKTADLREFIEMAYMEGLKAQQNESIECHLERINVILELMEEARIGVRG